MDLQDLEITNNEDAILLLNKIVSYLNTAIVETPLALEEETKLKKRFLNTDSLRKGSALPRLADGTTGLVSISIYSVTSHPLDANTYPTEYMDTPECIIDGKKKYLHLWGSQEPYTIDADRIIESVYLGLQTNVPKTQYDRIFINAKYSTLAEFIYEIDINGNIIGTPDSARKDLLALFKGRLSKGVKLFVGRGRPKDSTKSTQ